MVRHITSCLLQRVVKPSAGFRRLVASRAHGGRQAVESLIHHRRRLRQPSSARRAQVSRPTEAALHSWTVASQVAVSCLLEKTTRAARAAAR